ncbi:MAG: hypothetical protein U0930_23620 [Pirellulales bacterium]
MSLAKQNLPCYTIEDYRQWQGDWELWDGVAIAMIPSSFGKQQKVLFDLAAEIRNQRLGMCGRSVGRIGLDRQFKHGS